MSYGLFSETNEQSFDSRLNSSEIMIRVGRISEVVALSQKIPEFIKPHGPQEYQKRLDPVEHLILIAEVVGVPAGFKVGYAKENTFYSWMGGVLPTFRKMGIAQKLADEQEIWAKKRGYTTITFKTRNHHKGMLLFALKNGFDIIGFQEKESVDLHRIFTSQSTVGVLK